MLAPLKRTDAAFPCWHLYARSMSACAGLTNTVRAGLVSTTVGLIVNSRASLAWHFLAGQLAGCLHTSSSMSVPPALSALITHEAQRAGFGQGELQGMVANLGSVSRMVAPVLWGQIYAYSSQRGKPAAFFVAATAATTVQFILSCTLAVPRVEGAQLVAEQQAKLMAKAQQWVELDRKRQEDQSTEGQPAAK